jgi:hypothetical protein
MQIVHEERKERKKQERPQSLLPAPKALPAEHPRQPAEFPAGGIGC